MAEFQFPPFFSFPPYFTIQPVKETKDRQLDLWRDFLLAYCKHHRIFTINVDEEGPMFRNDKIQRRLNKQGRMAVLSHLVKSGSAEWIDSKTKSDCYVWWKAPNLWADQIFLWANQYGHRDSVVTFDEITGPSAYDPDLRGIPTPVLVRILGELEAQGKAAVFGAGGAAGGDEGVKFA